MCARTGKRKTLFFLARESIERSVPTMVKAWFNAIAGKTAVAISEREAEFPLHKAMSSRKGLYSARCSNNHSPASGSERKEQPFLYIFQNLFSASSALPSSSKSEGEKPAICSTEMSLCAPGNSFVEPVK